MVISDGRYTAQLVSDKGKSYPFDSIECMAAYEHNNPDVAEGAKLYVTNFTEPGKWLLVEESDIYMSDDIQSPMGLSLFAISTESNIPERIENAEQQTWQQTVEYVLTSWEIAR
jgi:copper chaperone NosL